MTVCTDVYVRPQSCGTVSIYPQQTHPVVPPPPSGGSPALPRAFPKGLPLSPYPPRLDDLGERRRREEEIALILALWALDPDG